MNRDKIWMQTCYIDQCTKKGSMLMYIACLYPTLASAHFYAITSNFLNFYLVETTSYTVHITVEITTNGRNLNK